MKKGLSRLRTRLSLGLTVLAAAGILAGAVRSGWTLTLTGGALLVLALLVRPRNCPTCGKKITLKPQWSEPGTGSCPYCGSRLAYDDEEEL